MTFVAYLPYLPRKQNARTTLATESNRDTQQNNRVHTVRTHVSSIGRGKIPTESAQMHKTSSHRSSSLCVFGLLDLPNERRERARERDDPLAGTRPTSLALVNLNVFDLDTRARPTESATSKSARNAVPDFPDGTHKKMLMCTEVPLFCVCVRMWRVCCRFNLFSTVFNYSGSSPVLERE